MSARPHLVLIDNYDSFTFNLVQYFAQAGAEVTVLRNDQTDLQGLTQLQATHLCLSPGPCTPNESGICLAAIRHFAGVIPILGVCLGHQAIAQVFGARIVRAPHVMHGKTSAIHHEQQGIFRALPTPFHATRYHSLCIAENSLPDELMVTARTLADANNPSLIMGIKHRQWAIEGVQFHPEAIQSEYGHELLRNFLGQGAP